MTEAGGWQQALDDVYLELRDELSSIWNGLGDAERRALAAIARGPGQLMRKSVLDEL